MLLHQRLIKQIKNPAPQRAIKTAAMLDVDRTVTDPGGEYLNRAMMDALKAQGITDIFFFTTMTGFNFTQELAGKIPGIEKSSEENRIYTRMRIIEEYKKAGFNVRAVVTPMDCVGDHPVGYWYDEYAKKYQAILEKSKTAEDPEQLVKEANEFSEMLRNQDRKASLVAHYLYNEGKSPKDREDTKGFMYEKLIEHLPADIDSLIYFDDSEKCQQSVQKAHDRIMSGDESTRSTLTRQPEIQQNVRVSEISIPQLSDLQKRVVPTTVAGFTYFDPKENEDETYSVDYGNYTQMIHNHHNQVVQDKKMELAIQGELFRILSDPELMDDAVYARGSAKIKGIPVSFSKLPQDLFDQNGEVKEDVADPNGIFIDKERIQESALRDHLGITIQGLSTRERLILEAAVMTAKKNVIDMLYVKQTPVDTPDDEKGIIHTTLTKNANRIVKYTMQKMGALHFKPDQQLQLTNESKGKLQTMLDSQWDIKASLLLHRIKSLQDMYYRLGRSRHSNDINKLLSGVTNLKADNAKDKFAGLVGLLETEFQRCENEFCKPFLGIGKAKTTDDFIKRINSDRNDYHYPRLLALILQSAENDHPGCLAKYPPDDNKISRIKPGHQTEYVKILPDLMDSESLRGNDFKEFKEFEKALNKAGFSRIQIYRLYYNYDPVGIPMIKETWPILKSLDETTFSQFVNGDKEIAVGIAKILKQPIEDIKNIKGAIDALNKRHPIDMTQQKKVAASKT